jgi:hypothetical protein
LNSYNPDFVIIDEISKPIKTDIWNILIYDSKI